MKGKCLSCHTGIQALVTTGKGLHAQVAGERCASCHPDHAGIDFKLVYWENGKPEAFDHARTGWRLQHSHASVECRTCHTPALQDSTLMALAKTTHPETSWLGLGQRCENCHGNVHGDPALQDCATCHEASKWNKAPGFDHQKTDYPLTGRHQDTDCAKCHGTLLTANLNVVSSGPRPRYHMNHDQCSDCHQDPHRGRFGAACNDCHQTSSFKDINQKSFDHGKTNYPLTGAHRALDCAKCHDPVNAWGKTPPYASCTSCHTDSHAGSATQLKPGTDCAACHGTESFAPATFTVVDHEKTGYPLVAKHQEVACRKCHATPEVKTFGPAKVRFHPPAGKCSDCHENVHGSQKLVSLESAACRRCHSEKRFAPTGFGIEDHRDLRFPLDGAHAEVSCRGCHDTKLAFLSLPPDSARYGRAQFAFAVGRTACADCHTDVHQGTAGEAGCNRCHGTASFRPSTVNNTTHVPPLQGAHRAVPCFECHPSLLHDPVIRTLRPAAVGLPKIPFRAQARVCADCHETPHGNQLSADCAACHSENRFAPADRFNHDRDARFALAGAHERVPCAGCHAGRDSEGRILYKPLDLACSSCHREPVGDRP